MKHTTAAHSTEEVAAISEVRLPYHDLHCAFPDKDCRQIDGRYIMVNCCAMSSDIAVHIVGAGLTGLSAAHYLEGRDCLIHEKSAGAGGHAVTVEEDGYRFDRTGHLLHLRDPQIRAWIERLLEGRLLSIARKSLVFSHGGYTRYPYQANTFGLPPEVAFECLKGYFDALQKRESLTPSTQPRDFQEFCRVNFGQGFSDHFFIPYHRKIWGVDLTDVTAEWCARFVPIPKYEDVLAGAVGLNNRELGYNTNFSYPKCGIGELSAALSQRVPAPVQYDDAVVNVDFRARVMQTTQGSYTYDTLLWSAPLSLLVRALVDPPAEVADAGGALRCTSLWYLDIALEVPCGVPMHWVYVPEMKYPFYRVGCYSNFSPDMAPAGKAGLYVELASREQPSMQTLMPQVTQGLLEMRIIDRAEDIRFARLRHLEHAYVIFDHHYYAALATLEPFLREHGIYNCGRYGAWNYSSMEDALRFGREAAEWVVAQKSAKPGG